MANIDYTPIPRGVTSSADDVLIGRYAKLRALAWEFGFDNTPPCPVEQLIAYLGIGRSRFYESISEMESLGWISRSQAQGKVKINFLPVAEGPAADGVSPENWNSPINRTVIKNQTVKLINTIDIYSLTDSALSESSPENRTPIFRTKRKIPEFTNPQDFFDCVSRLVQHGVFDALANKLIQMNSVDRVLESCEVYEWALKTGKASGPGWLVGYLAKKWQEPIGYIPPGWICDECGGRKDRHQKGCSASLGGWDDGELIEVEITCKTCGFVEGHAPDCWRKDRGDDIGMPIPLQGKHGLGEQALVSACDYDFLVNFPWYLGSGGYAITRAEKQITFMHKYIAGVSDDRKVLHINQKHLDNRRSNLKHP